MKYKSTAQYMCINLCSIREMPVILISRCKHLEMQQAKHEFLNGLVTVKRDGCPLKGQAFWKCRNESVVQMHDLVRNYRRLTLHKMAKEVGILYGSCQAILTILGMSYVSANFFP